MCKRRELRRRFLRIQYGTHPYTEEFMRSHKGLIALLVILIGGMATVMHLMNVQKDPHYRTTPPPPPKVGAARAGDLAKLTDKAAHNWQLDPKMKTVTTKSGLKYQDIAVGTGDTPKSGQSVIADYVGWTTRGRRFDTSLEKDRNPIVFQIGKGKVIAGWDEGISTMKIGGIRRLFVPSKLGYGELGALPAIEPNADLVFMIKVLGIESTGAGQGN